MAIIVEEQYRVNMYLDTNILVDYVVKKYPLLNKCIDFFAQCPFVNLRSSHYVLFEFTEVRKVGLFWQRAAPDDKEDYKRARATIRRCWKYNGRDYNEFKADISAQVKSELEMLRSDLSLDFDDHVLHEELVYPTNSLCLATKISKEDCLIMISCMNPHKEQKLDHCLLLSRDEQYYKAYRENKDEADKIFDDCGLNKPTMIRTESLQVDEHDTKYNLYEDDEHVDIIQILKNLILKTLKGKLLDNYVGVTYLHGVSEMAKKCIFFNMDGDDKTLKKSEGLVFITKDLSEVVILGGPFEFWNNEKVDLPHSNPDYPNYSFLTHEMNTNVLEKLREDGNLVFYYDLV